MGKENKNSFRDQVKEMFRNEIKKGLTIKYFREMVDYLSTNKITENEFINYYSDLEKAISQNLIEDTSLLLYFVVSLENASVLAISSVTEHDVDETFDKLRKLRIKLSNKKLENIDNLEVILNKHIKDIETSNMMSFKVFCDYCSEITYVLMSEKPLASSSCIVTYLKSLISATVKTNNASEVMQYNRLITEMSSYYDKIISEQDPNKKRIK